MSWVAAACIFVVLQPHADTICRLARNGVFFYTTRRHGLSQWNNATWADGTGQLSACVCPPCLCFPVPVPVFLFCHAAQQQQPLALGCFPHEGTATSGAHWCREWLVARGLPPKHAEEVFSEQ